MNFACLVLCRTTRMVKNMATEPPIADINNSVRSLTRHKPD